MLQAVSTKGLCQLKSACIKSSIYQLGTEFRLVSIILLVGRCVERDSIIWIFLKGPNLSEILLFNVAPATS